MNNSSSLRYRKYFSRRLLTAYCLLFTVYLFTSCIPQKKLIYLQDKSGNPNTSQEFSNPMRYYHVKSGDEIYLKVMGLDDKTLTLFGERNQQNTQFSKEAIYFQSFTVTDSGYIYLPSLGRVEAKGKTIDEIQHHVQKKFNEIVNFGIVTIKLANYKVTVLGEVENPMTVFIADDLITIFEALGMAGDLTNYGNREEISIIRQTEKGPVYRTISLLDRNILNSEYYYIYPGDVIYVPQMAAKAFGLANFQWSLLFSLVSTTLSAISVIVLVKNSTK